MSFDPKAPYQVYYDSLTGAKQHVKGFSTKEECERYVADHGGWLKTLNGEYRLFIATREQVAQMDRDYSRGRSGRNLTC